MNNSNQQSEQAGWLSVFLKELVSMPRRHTIVFLIAPVLLVLLEVEITKGMACSPHFGNCGSYAAFLPDMGSMAVQPKEGWKGKSFIKILERCPQEHGKCYDNGRKASS